MKLNLFFVFVLALLVCQACDESLQQKKPSQIDRYAQVDSLLIYQASWLSSKGTKLQKRVRLDQETQRTTWQPDSSGWYQELEIFSVLDLNKPSFVGAYESDTLTNEAETRIIYKARPGENVNVKKLEILKSANQLLFEGAYRDENLLYTLHRDLTLDFKNNSGRPVLNRYEIRGFQKMRFVDTVFFEIEGVVE